MALATSTTPPERRYLTSGPAEHALDLGALLAASGQAVALTEADGSPTGPSPRPRCPSSRALTGSRSLAANPGPAEHNARASERRFLTPGPATHALDHGQLAASRQAVALTEADGSPTGPSPRPRCPSSRALTGSRSPAANPGPAEHNALAS